MIKFFPFCKLILFVNINLQAQKPLVDTTHFHQLTTSERLLIKEWVLKIKSAKSDSFKIELIQEMYMQMNDNYVWILYTDLMEKHIDLYLKAKGKGEVEW